MRVAILSETYAKNMGYSQNALSKAMARLGVDVHLVTADLPPYYNDPDFQRTYGAFTGIVEDHPTIELTDGYTVHYLPHRRTWGYVRLQGLFEKLRTLRPDVVQTFAAISWIPLDAALAQPRLHYGLFTGSHTTASVFPLAQRRAPIWDKARLRSIATRAVPGRFISWFTQKCYAATRDCADIAVRFFGVQANKVDVCPLGVDTDLFSPIADEQMASARKDLRHQLGFADSDIVCIYTGRFSNAKNPLALAQAVARLMSQGKPFRALFVGAGAQADAIQACQGCVIRPFVPNRQLSSFFRAADIGVWPTQESMSMLDAAACGIPIIVNDTLQAVERIDGNGIAYRLNDVDDLMRALESLREPDARRRLGDVGAHRMAREFSWVKIAERRLRDYEARWAWCVHHD